jgi:hypothetical protein
MATAPSKRPSSRRARHTLPPPPWPSGAFQHIGAQALAGQARFGVVHAAIAALGVGKRAHRAGEKAAGLRQAAVGQQARQLVGEVGVRLLQLGQTGRPLGGRQVEQLVDQRAQAQPARGVG